MVMGTNMAAASHTGQLWRALASAGLDVDVVDLWAVLAAADACIVSVVWLRGHLGVGACVP